MLTKETEEGIKTMCTVISVDKGCPATMFDAFEDAEKRGEAIGEARGKEIGETRLANLLKKLYSLGRADDVQRAINDKNYRDTLMKELAIQ